MIRIIAFALTIPALIGTGFFASETLRDEPNANNTPTNPSELIVEPASSASTASAVQGIAVNVRPETSMPAVKDVQQKENLKQIIKASVSDIVAAATAPVPVAVSETNTVTTVKPTLPSVDLDALHREEEMAKAAAAQREAEEAEEERKAQVDEVFDALEERMIRFNSEFKFLIDTYESTIKNGQSAPLSIAIGQKNKAIPRTCSESSGTKYKYKKKAGAV
jgi:hypothetical protein